MDSRLNKRDPQLLQALEAWINGDYPSIRATADAFYIPRSTLQD